MSHNLFDTLQQFKLGAGGAGKFYSLPALEKAGVGKVSRLPVSIRIVLESVLRNCDGKKVSEHHVRELANWKPTGERVDEIPFVVARVVLQDFTGVPLLADLAAMRNVAHDMGKNPKTIEPLVPVDLVVDHSVMIDHYGTKDALDLNMKLEFQRNAERYEFMKWGMQAFDTFKVVPPGIGIVHQVNLEYLARGVHSKAGIYYPDSLVGTDSHTTMINGIGVVGWGVGGIEAEAGMLGQPVYFLTPDVVGVELSGRLNEGITATDLVLTVTEMLRKEKVVGKFVEFFGEGAATLAVPDRATIANMAPEYGATMGFFPVDDATVEYLRNTGRTDAEVDAFASYFRAQGLYGMPRSGDIDYTKVLKLDLASIKPSVAGPKRPQDRIELASLKAKFTDLFSKPIADNGFAKKPDELAQRFKAANGVELGSGDVLIAAITSCTNTSNPSVLIAAGLLAQKAVAKGLKVRPHIKTSLAPGSRVVTDYLTRAGLLPSLEALGFNVAAYGCTTCIGNAGDLAPEFNETIVGEGPGLRGGTLRQPQLRGADPPEPQGELPRVAAPGRGLRHRRHRAQGPDHRAAGHRRRRQARVPQGRLADLAGDRRVDAVREGPGDLPHALRRPRQRQPAVEGHCRRRRAGLRLAVVDVHRQAAVLRRLRDDHTAPSASSRARAHWASSATR